MNTLEALDMHEELDSLLSWCKQAQVRAPSEQRHKPKVYEPLLSVKHQVLWMVRIDFAITYSSEASASSVSNLHHLPITLPMLIVRPAHTLSSFPNPVLPFNNGICSFQGSCWVPFAVSLSAIEVSFSFSFRSSARMSLVLAEFAASTAIATLRDKPCAEYSLVEWCSATRPRMTSTGLQELRFW